MPTSYEALALLIALLSALYARWAVKEAKRANHISLHQYRKDIYDAFRHLTMHMTQHADQAVLSEVNKFYHPSRNAKFYFDSELAKEIERYFDLCFNIADKSKTQQVRSITISEAHEAEQCALALNYRLAKVIAVHK
ncbi:hypothetical protein [Aeromonas sp. R9-1]|uniref:hypothetical protein n=1 Tax=Aeromonas sp. R9-1 TaxID=3138478 RepID=UPI0034A16708